MHHTNGFRGAVSSKAYDMNRIREVNTYPVGAPFPRVIAVTSGKGGVGKTSIVANLAIAFRRLGRRVLILDGNLGLANIDIIFGLNPVYNIEHVISGEKDLSEVIVEGPEEISIIPAGSGVHELVDLTNGQKLHLLNEFDTLNEDFDVLLIDTGAGISSNVIYFNIAAQERIVVATPEPSSITAAYALIKVVFTQHGTRSFKVLVNMVNSAEEGKSVFENLSNVSGNFLKDISLEYIGFISKDDMFQKAVKQRCTVSQLYPESESSKDFFDLAQSLLNGSKNRSSDGNIKFFWRKLVSRH